MLEESRGFYQTTKTFYQKERPGAIHCLGRGRRECHARSTGFCIMKNLREDFMMNKKSSKIWNLLHTIAKFCDTMLSIGCIISVLTGSIDIPDIIIICKNGFFIAIILQVAVYLLEHLYERLRR